MQRKPRRRLPNVECRAVGDVWRWRARIKIHSVVRVGSWRDTEREAFDDVDKLRSIYSMMQPRRSDVPTLRGALDAMEQRERQRVDASTFERGFVYRRDWLLAMWADDTPLHRIDEREVAWMVDEALRRGRSVSTVRKYLSLLRQAFAHHGLALPRVRVPRPQRKAMEFFAGAELRDLLERMASMARGPVQRRDVAVARFISMTGLRSGEFLRLRVSHLRDPLGIPIIAKDRATPRRVPVTDLLRPVLDELVEHACADGRLLPSLSAWNLMWRRWSERLGVRVNGRLLRRSFITMAAYSGLPLADVRDLAGHRHSTTTDIYMQAVSSRLHDAALRAQAALGGTTHARPDDVDARSQR